jgi:hypothetical protein
MGDLLSNRVVAMCAVAGATYGSEGTPDYALGIPQYRNTEPVALDINQVDLNPLQQSYSSQGTLPGRKLTRLTPGMILMGHNNVVDIEDFYLDAIFRMCGFQYSTASSTHTYKLRSTGFESGAVKYAMFTQGSAAVEHFIHGVIGSFRMQGTAAKEIQIDPTLSGIYATPTIPGGLDPSDVTLPANTAEVMVNEGLSITPQGDSLITPVFKSFNFDCGWNVAEWTDANTASGLSRLVYDGRKPSLEMMIGMDHADYINSWIPNIMAGVSKRHTLTFTHGTVAGRKCKVTIIAQLQDAPMGTEAGQRTLNLKYMPIDPAAADGEVRFDFF